MRAPTARGPLSAALAETLTGPVRRVALRGLALQAMASCGGDAVLSDEDVQLSLAVLYELHHDGIDGADPEWEWSGDLLEVRRLLEQPFEAAVRAAAAPAVSAARESLGERPSADEVAAALFAMVAADEGPSLSAFMDRKATIEQFRELLVHRSWYHLKEADPHSWAIPRLRGRPKAGLVEVQADEYGGGRPERMHSVLFAQTMRALGLDDGYGRHLDDIPGSTLATTNAIIMFGLHRRLRGAVAGHLAALEMTSSLPNRRYGNGLRRLGLDAEATDFFDEHVEADAVHEQIAGRDLAGALAEEHPELLGDVLLGAAASLALDARAGSGQLAAWQAGRSSLRQAASGSQVA